MKNKKVLRLSLIGAGAMGIAFAMTAVIGHNTGLFVGKGFDGHTADCEWNHYSEYAPTYGHAGSKEFWACCTHPGNHVLEAPASSHITDMGPYTGHLEIQDDRYIPQLEGGNAFVTIDVGNGSYLSPLRSETQLQNVTSISFIYRMNNIPETKWFGWSLSTSTNPDVYPYAADTNPLIVDWKTVDSSVSVNDGLWHQKTLPLTGSGYLSVNYAASEFPAGATIDFDDIIVTTTSGEVFIDFDNNNPFMVMDQYAEFTGEKLDNKFMRITAPIDYSLAFTPAVYENVSNVSFKYRVNGGLKEGKDGAWFGFAIKANGDNPDAYSDTHDHSNSGPDWKTTYITETGFDGVWKNASYNFNASGHVCFISSGGEFTDVSTVDIDDVVITYNSGRVVSDNFDFGKAMLFQPNHNNNWQKKQAIKGVEIGLAADAETVAPVKFEGYANKNTLVVEKNVESEKGLCAKITEWTGDEHAWIVMAASKTAAQLADELEAPVGKYVFDIYNAGANNVSGLGIRIGADYWNCSGPVLTLTAHEWTHVELDVGSYDGGSHGTFTLTNVGDIGLGKWVPQLTTIVGSASDALYITSIRAVAAENPGPEPVSLGVVALDASTTTVSNIEYSTVFTATTGADAEYGRYVQLDNWGCAASQNRCWFGMSKTRELSAIQTELDGSVGTYFFYMYNPLESDFAIQILLNHEYSCVARKTLASKAWTRVEIATGGHTPEGSSTSIQLTEAHQLGIDHSFSDNGSVCGSGFKVTSIYATKYVNPAPFGVVAWDAFNGSLRDIKGYGPTYTLANGIDANYGAYMQINDWKCKSDKNQCWVTLSDTAKAVADIETELGKSITNYFFYVYNPLEEDFSFKIMLKSSSGMNPNVNVTCTAGAWTKVTVAYDHLDNGGAPSYPNLTSASQLGLTHVFSGNGETVGSGWKITSVYAE